MKKFLLVLALTIVVAAGAALTYYYFEVAVRHSISFIWDDLLDTRGQRWVVVPACLVLGLAFFGLQHYLDPRSETRQSEGLGQAPTPTVANFAKVLGIGFASLLAGASLGPEAILVPACLLIGAYVAVKLQPGNQDLKHLLSMVGFVALFTAFFDSFVMGLLGLLLAVKQVGARLNVRLVLLGVFTVVVTLLILAALSSHPFIHSPKYQWNFSAATILVSLLLFGCGYVTLYVLRAVENGIDRVRSTVQPWPWAVRGMVASIGLALLYLLGGSLVEFTGNQSVVPMLHQSAKLGVVGLLWLVVVKLATIGWSKTLWYRGGLVFPNIFVASTLVAIANLYVSGLSFIVCVIAAVAGMIVANFKLKILF